MRWQTCILASAAVLLASCLPRATATPVPAPTPAAPSCPTQYELHADQAHGYSVCFPAGWFKYQRVDEDGVFCQIFTSPAGAERSEDLEYMAVYALRMAEEAPPPLSDDEWLALASLWMQQNGVEPLGEPRVISVSGHKGVEFAHQGEDLYGDELLALTGWSAALVAGDRMFLLEVSGVSEHSAAIDRIYGEVIPHLAILPQQ